MLVASDTSDVNIDWFNPKMECPELWTFHFLGYIEGYDFYFGIPEGAVSQIVEYTADPSDVTLRTFTSDMRRFASRESIARWYADEGRYVFTLLNSERVLVGLWYARKVKLPSVKIITEPDLKAKLDTCSESVHTGWVRVYPPFRGRGISEKLIRIGGECYRKVFPGSCMCIDIDEENVASRSTYERSGYLHLGFWENEKSVGNWEKSRRVYVEFDSNVEE